MFQSTTGSLFLVLLILAVAAALLAANRALLLPRARLPAQVVSPVLAAAAFYLAASAVGTSLDTATSALPVAVFLGVLWVQPVPASRRGVCLSLAAAVGLLAALAALWTDVLAAAAAAAACGYLSGLGREPGA